MRAALESAEFRREDAFLLILIATDEDDCSHDGLLTGDDGDPRAGCSAPTDLVAEYVSDIEESAHPELTSVAVIAGVPPDIIDLPLDALLADPRMIPTLDGDSLAPSCGVGTSSATPPRRLVSWLAALQQARIPIELQSICEPGATSRALDVLRASRAAPPLSGGACFPRALPADAAGHVRCDVEIMLPLDDDGVTPMTCEDAGIDFVALGPTIDASSGRPRARCLVPQLTPDVLARGDTPGWGYDATSAEAASACESGARAAFSQFERFNRVTITLRCEQPLPEGAPACTDGG